MAHLDVFTSPRICSQCVEVRARDFNETLFTVWKCCSLCGQIDCLYVLLMICPMPSVLVQRKAGQHPQGWLTHISVSYYIRIAILSLLFIASSSTTEESQHSETSCTTNFLCSSVVFLTTNVSYIWFCTYFFFPATTKWGLCVCLFDK